MDKNQISKEAYSWILAKGPPLLMGIVVLVAGLWLIKVLSAWLNSGIQKKKIDPSLKPFLIGLSVIVLRVLLVLGVMQIVGIQMTVFAALIGAIGVAAGLALSGTLQNFASGVIILFLKPFSVGDNIIAQGQEGTVTVIKIFYTIITTFDNRTVVIPNSKLSNEVIVNVSITGSRRLDIELKFSNGIDFNDIKKNINDAIDQSENMLEKPDRRIGISSLDPDGYKVMLNVWVHAHGFMDTKMAFQERLLKKLKLNNVIK